MATGSQYEFSQEQNALIGSLASKMSLVGMFFLVVGIIYVVTALMVVVAIYQDKIPADWMAKSKDYMNKLPDDVKKQAEEHMSKIPPKNHLWGIALNAGLMGLFNLMVGSWTRNAASSFQQIVSTQGRDISHLMNALASLHSMYALMYTLLVVTLLCGLLFLGLSLFGQFSG